MSWVVWDSYEEKIGGGCFVLLSKYDDSKRKFGRKLIKEDVS